jgi:DNA-binding response OmpR family regulator
MPHVLIVEDDVHIRDLIALHLGLEGLQTSAVGDGRQALDRVTTEAFDLVLLDLMLPGIDGISICRALRRSGPNQDAPVLMLTARREESDKVLGLESGADDYLAKPFAFVELAARVHALGRRARPAAPPVLRRAGLTLDPARREVYRNERYVPLSNKEFAVLAELLRADGAVVSTEQLLEKAWDEHADPFTGVVRLTILKLRRKLGDPPVVETVPGAGYRIS